MLRWAKGSDLPWPIYRQDESHFQNNDFFIICFTLSSFPFPYLWILSDDILNMIFSPGPLQASREVKDILVQCWLFNAKYVLLIRVEGSHHRTPTRVKWKRLKMMRRRRREDHLREDEAAWWPARGGAWAQAVHPWKKINVGFYIQEI